MMQNTLVKNDEKSQKETDRKIIKSFAGNYRVSFKFAETFAPDEGYVYQDRHFSSAKEVVLLLEDSEDKISLQHILYAGKTLIKHWRQDWLYQNREIWKLVKNHHWKKTVLSAHEVKGTWTQKVYQVDDAPRYEGLGTWVHVDNRHFWESTADAALPRREISTARRTDYNILRRHSHIEAFKDGSWMIEQDNEKINRHPNLTEDLICMEKGLETFTPKSYDASKIKAFWKTQENFWADVRRIWADIRQTQDEIKINGDEELYKSQFNLAKLFSGDQYNREKAQTAIKDLLIKHVENYTE